MGILSSIGDFLGFGATLGSDSDIYGTSGDDLLRGTDNGELIVGGDGNDWIKGYGGIDRIFGGNGDDLIEGGAGNDLIDGGSGNDTVSYFNTNHGVIVNLEFGTASTLGAGPVDSDTLVSIENVKGSFYDDYIQGTDGNNTLDGGAGNDVLNGWGGNDILIGGFGNDTIVGGEGNDRVSGGFNNDTLYGGNGIDTLDYSYAYEGMNISLALGQSSARFPSSTIDNDSFSGFENVVGSYYDDVIEGSTGKNVIDGGLGNDTVSYRTSSNSVALNLSLGWGQIGDAFQDTYISIENIIGTEHASGDGLTGDNNNNRIEGLGGNDVIYGLGGDDTLLGGEGTDWIEGGDGNDYVSGGEGANHLDGGDGIDTLDLNPSYGGIGAIGPGVTVDMVAGTVDGLDQDGTTIANFEWVRGTSFDDTLLGDGAVNILQGFGNNDQINGRGGGDFLDGGDGRDTVNGGSGDDFISGGRSRDTLIGGGDSDVFVYAKLSDSGTSRATRDIIRDFATGTDHIELSNLDADTGLAGDQAFSFIGDSAFSGVAGELRAEFDGTNTLISADVNGDAAADFQILLTGGVALTGGDFIL